MSLPKYNTLFETIKSTILYITGLTLLLFFTFKIISIVLLVIFALVLGIIISAPVSKFEKRGMKRWLASLIIFIIIFGVSIGLGWLIVPHITNQLDVLISNLPSYYTSASNHIASILKNYPEFNREIQDSGVSIGSAIPSVGKTIIGLGNFSFGLIGGIFLFIVFVCLVVFYVSHPQPIVELYLSLFQPRKRESAKNAMQHTTVMLVGWMKSNLIGGAIQSVLVYAFLSIVNVPGALVWAALAFFSELIPKLGFYIMAIPPTLVALSISPLTAFWCLLFFLLLNELVSDFLMPKLRSTTMNIHPVSSLVMLLAMGAAFGLTGALLATPMAAIIKAYYEEFYLKKLPEDPEMDHRVEEIIYNK